MPLVHGEPRPRPGESWSVQGTMMPPPPPPPSLPSPPPVAAPLSHSLE